MRPPPAPALPSDLNAPPKERVREYIEDLARTHGVEYRRTGLDDFAEAVERVSDAEEGALDATGKLLAALHKRGVIDGRQMARLLTNYLAEQGDQAAEHVSEQDLWRDKRERQARDLEAVRDGQVAGEDLRWFRDGVAKRVKIPGSPL